MNRPLSSFLPQTSPRNLRLWVFFGVLVAIAQLSDPLAEATLLEATGFWSGRLLAVAGSLVLAEWLVGRFFAERWLVPAWLKPAVITTLIAAVPIAAAETGLEAVFPQKAEYDDTYLRELSPLLAGLGEYLTIVSLLVPINLVLWLLIDHRAVTNPSHAQSDAPAIAQEPEFLAKTGGIRLGEVMALAAEEHYVRVCTRDRSELIHHRFGDAVSEMPASLGMQVHRSWWVADGAVAGARRAGRRYQLQLRDGTLVPVSDRFYPLARSRGLLRRRMPVSRG